MTDVKAMFGAIVAVVVRELTRFWHPDLIKGTRLVAIPQVSYPIIGPSFFENHVVTTDSRAMTLTVCPSEGFDEQGALEVIRSELANLPSRAKALVVRYRR